MKYLFILFTILWNTAYGTTYYFSATGSDAANGTSTITPKQTLTGLAAINLNPGDIVLFKRGDTFYGTYSATDDGTSGAGVITYGAYGTGAKPIITGFVSVVTWTNLGANIWESTFSPSTLTTCNMVYINGANTAMGRYPNSSYLQYQSHSGNTSITSSSLNSGTTNWTGAEVVIRMNRFVIDRNIVSSHSGGTLAYADNGGPYTPIDNFGFFIQNDVRTLDVEGEWYYNPTSKKIRMYHIGASAPSGVKVATIQDVINTNAKDYLVFTDLVIEGANRYGAYTVNSTLAYFNTCDFPYMGTAAVYGYPSSPSLRIEDCTATHCNDAGFYTGSSDNSIVRNSIVYGVGIYKGMGKTVNSTFEGITSNGDNALIENCSVRAAGYNGIKWAGEGTVIKYNFVDSTNFSKDDGGGIYNHPNGAIGGTTSVKRNVHGNIVLNSIGAPDGTATGGSEAHGIYSDGADDNIDFVDNFVDGAELGLYFNNGRNCNITSNTIYNSTRGLAYQRYLAGTAMTGNNVSGNIFFAKTATQYPAYYELLTGSLAGDFVAGNNRYCRPILETTTIWVDPAGSNVYYTLAEWKTFSGVDATSAVTAKTITSVTDLLPVYNKTGATVVQSIPGIYIDARGVTYNGSISLLAHSGAVLIKTGSVPSQIITNSVLKNVAFRDVIIEFESQATANTKHYEIYHKVDNGAWRKASQMQPKIITTQYFSQIAGSVGTNYFYIKSVDKDGRSTTSATLSVKKN